MLSSGANYWYNCQKLRKQRLKVGSAVPVGGVKVPPTASIFPQKCGRWHFGNADGRENPAKLRPVEPQNVNYTPLYARCHWKFTL